MPDRSLTMIAYSLGILKAFTVSIRTTQGRIRIPFVSCGCQRELLTHRKGESDPLLQKRRVLPLGDL